MRVRIVKDPRNGQWTVEAKKWWPNWYQLDYFYGENAEIQAEAFAKNILNPTVREITKDSK